MRFVCTCVLLERPYCVQTFLYIVCSNRNIVQNQVIRIWYNLLTLTFEILFVFPDIIKFFQPAQSLLIEVVSRWFFFKYWNLPNLHPKYQANYIGKVLSKGVLFPLQHVDDNDLRHQKITVRMTGGKLPGVCPKSPNPPFTKNIARWLHCTPTQLAHTWPVTWQISGLAEVIGLTARAWDTQKITVRGTTKKFPGVFPKHQILPLSRWKKILISPKEPTKYRQRSTLNLEFCRKDEKKITRDPF